MRRLVSMGIRFGVWLLGGAIRPRRDMRARASHPIKRRWQSALDPEDSRHKPRFGAAATAARLTTPSQSSEFALHLTDDAPRNLCCSLAIRHS